MGKMMYNLIRNSHESKPEVLQTHLNRKENQGSSTHQVDGSIPDWSTYLVTGVTTSFDTTSVVRSNVKLCIMLNRSHRIKFTNINHKN